MTDVESRSAITNCWGHILSMYAAHNGCGQRSSPAARTRRLGVIERFTPGLAVGLDIVMLLAQLAFFDTLLSPASRSVRDAR